MICTILDDPGSDCWGVELRESGDGAACGSASKICKNRSLSELLDFSKLDSGLAFTSCCEGPAGMQCMRDVV